MKNISQINNFHIITPIEWKFMMEPILSNRVWGLFFVLSPPAWSFPSSCSPSPWDRTLMGPDDHKSQALLIPNRLQIAPQESKEQIFAQLGDLQGKLYRIGTVLDCVYGADRFSHPG